MRRRLVARMTRVHIHFTGRDTCDTRTRRSVVHQVGVRGNPRPARQTGWDISPGWQSRELKCSPRRGSLGYGLRMHPWWTPWAQALEYLEIRPVEPIEDGLRFVRGTREYQLEIFARCWSPQPRVRLVVRPTDPGGAFLLVGRALAPRPAPAATGDSAFDEEIAVLHGAPALIHRLDQPLRARIMRVVGELGATLSARESTLEPQFSLQLTELAEIAEAIAELTSLAVDVCRDPSIEACLDRWWNDEGAPYVSEALDRHIDQKLSVLTARQSALACEVVAHRCPHDPVSRFGRMPPHPPVLQAWLRAGDPLDERIGTRVLEALRDGEPTPVAHYLAWLLNASARLAGAEAVAYQLWRGADLAHHRDVPALLVDRLPTPPPSAARLLLQQVVPRSGEFAPRLASMLGAFRQVESDARLLAWLTMPGSVVRRAAADALAERVAEELGAQNATAVKSVAEAARTSGCLVAALVSRVPREHTTWLAALRPHGEPDAIALIRRLGEGGANVDRELLYWLDRGTRAVQLAAASALATAGSPRSILPLRERGMGWFGDSVVREQCRLAAKAVTRRWGGPGALTLAQGEEGALAEAKVPGELAVVEK